MTENVKTHHEDPEERIEAAIEHTEGFLQRNSKKLLIIVGAIVLITGAYFTVKYLILPPREQKASALMFVAEQMFAADSIDLALNGNKNQAGFLDVIDQYGSTNVGNTACHYAGVCYMKKGEYQKALDYLSKYSAVKGIAAEIINAENYGLQADALVQLNKASDAVNMYKKAVAASENDLTTPYFLKKLGLVYEKLGESKSALESYQTIADSYPRSYQARDIDKYIGRVEQLLQ